MILAMKIISVGFDLDSGALSTAPGPLEFCGYLFNVSAHAYACTCTSSVVKGEVCCLVVVYCD